MTTVMQSSVARLFNEGAAHADDIAPIHARGDIAVVALRPRGVAATAAVTLGCNGKDPMFRMPRAVWRAYASAMEVQQFLPTARWLRAEAGGRIFLVGDGRGYVVDWRYAQAASPRPASIDVAAAASQATVAQGQDGGAVDCDAGAAVLAVGRDAPP